MGSSTEQKYFNYNHLGYYKHKESNEQQIIVLYKVVENN